MQTEKEQRPAPADEPERQYYFMELLRRHNEERSAALGRSLTYHIETFGCPTVIVTRI